MNVTQYLITEFTGNSLAIRKPLNNEFSVDELRELTVFFRDAAEVKTLYVANLRNKQSIQLLACTFEDPQDFDALMSQMSTAEMKIPKNTFYISGFQYDDAKETCTLTFHSTEPTGFTDLEMSAFANQMYTQGAESVFNKRLDGKSALHYRLYTFEIMTKRHFFEPIHELSCTFKNDAIGKETIKDLFKHYSKTPESLSRDCYESCIISAYKDRSTCTLMTVNPNDFFTKRNLSQICYWLHTLGAKSVIPNFYYSSGKIFNPTIECAFDPDDENFKVKFDDFITYRNEMFLKNEKSNGTLSEDATEYSLNLYLRLQTAGNTFIVLKNDDGTEKFTRAERGYLLSKFYELCTESILTEESYITCTFADDELGHLIRAQAIFALLNK